MANDETNAEEKSKKGGLVKIVVIVACAFVLLGVGIGFGFMIANIGKSDADELAGIITPSEDKTQSEEEDETSEDQEDLPSERVKQILEKQEVFDTKYYEFPGNFTANLYKSRKFIQVGVAVATQYDEEVIMNVENHELPIRSRIIGILGDRQENDISGVENKEKLAAEITEGINQVLIDKTGFGGVEFVYFTSFVIQ